MKASKRIVAGLLAVLLGLSMMITGMLTAHADTFFTEGDFRFAVTAGDVVTVAEYYGNSTEVTLPNEVNGRAVTGVYTRCFENTAVTSVVIPEGYTSIGNFAFNGCEALVSVTLPLTLRNIGMMAFSDCASLEDVNLGVTDLRSIGFAAFNNCTSLESATLPDTLTSLGENAFANCASLGALTLSASLTVIPEYAFYGCAALTKVSIPSSVTTLGEGCFENTALTGVWVPEGVTSIGTNAFAPANAVVCFAGSVAAAYCTESGAQNAVIVQKIMGDANADGRVNVNDVTAIQRQLAEIEDLTVYQQLLANVNGTGGVSVEDATMIQMFLAEFTVVFAEL